MYKKKRLIIIIGVIIFALIIIFTAYTLWHLNKCTSNLLTEKDMLDATNDMAKNWSSTAYLVTIMVGGGYVECGEYHVTDMVYVYLDNTSISKEEICRGIEVIYEEGNLKTRNITWSWSPEVGRPLGTWDITCIEAYRIAKKNKEVKKFLKTFPKPNVEGFMLSNESGIPIWWIEMVGGKNDESYWANIGIDAITGEILYLNVFPVGDDFPLVCFSAIVIIIAILITVLFIKRSLLSLLSSLELYFF